MRISTLFLFLTFTFQAIAQPAKPSSSRNFHKLIQQNTRERREAETKEYQEALKRNMEAMSSQPIKMEGIGAFLSEYRVAPVLHAPKNEIFKGIVNVAGAVKDTPLFEYDINAETGRSEKRLNEAGEKLKRDFCSFATKDVSGGDAFRVSSYMGMPVSSGMVKRAYAYEKQGAKAGERNLTPKHKSLLQKMNTIGKNTMARFCAGKDAYTCGLALVEPDGLDRFKEVCEDAFDTYIATPALDLASNYESFLAQELSELDYKKPSLGGDQKGASCGNNKNCYFTSENGANSCNPYHCSMTDEASLKGIDLEVTIPYLLSSPGYSFASDDSSLCDSCFKKEFEKVVDNVKNPNKEFKKEKKSARERLEDQLAAGHAGKKILGLIGKMQTAFDLETLYADGRDDSTVPKNARDEKMCEEELTGLLRQLDGKRCGNGLSKDRVKARLEAALESIGVGKTKVSNLRGFGTGIAGSGARLAEELMEKVNLSRRGNSCSRGDYAQYAQMQWNMIDNAEYGNALNTLLDKAYEYSSAGKDLEALCKNQPEESFPELYAKKMEIAFWRNAESKVREAFSRKWTPSELMSEICSGDDEKISLNIACGKVDNNPLFKRMAQRTQAGLEKFFREHDVYEDGESGVENLKNYLTKSVGAQVRATFEVPMKLNPALKLTLENWDAVCDAREKMKENNGLTGIGFSDYIDSAHTQGDFGAKIADFESKACKDSSKDVLEALCYNGDLLPDEQKESSPYSVDDINSAKEAVLAAAEEDVAAGLAFNSLSCEVKSAGLAAPKAFSSESVTSPNFSVDSNTSYYEAALANHALMKKNQSPKPFGDLNYEDFNQCSSGSRAAVQNYITGTHGQIHSKFKDYDVKKSKKNREQLVAQTETIEMTAQSKYELEGDPFADPGEYGVSSGISGVGGDFVAGGVNSAATSRGVAASHESKTVGDFDPKNKIVKVEDESPSSSGSSSEERAEYKDLVGSFSPVTNPLQTPVENPPEFANYQQAFRGPASLQPSSAQESGGCDETCLESIIKQQDKGAAKEVVAEKVGIKNFEASSESVKQVFEDVLEDKLNGQQIAKILEENEKLRSEMADIKKSLKEKETKFKRADGEEMERKISAPAQSKAVVYNPRNKSANEFVAPEYFKERAQEFSPSFSPEPTPKRVSLGDFSSQRRAIASKTPVTKVKSFNGDIDKSFLQSHASSKVDDSFVEQYVEHVDINAGSIEHLVVFENGRPAKIRVPDPENPGAYVEHPIKGEMVERILEKVEEDEVESYAVYNMVNFGQSLTDFMQSVEDENSNLTTLGALNMRLQKLRDLQ